MHDTSCVGEAASRGCRTKPARRRHSDDHNELVGTLPAHGRAGQRLAVGNCIDIVNTSMHYRHAYSGAMNGPTAFCSIVSNQDSLLSV